MSKKITHLELKLNNDQVYQIKAHAIAHDIALNYQDDHDDPVKGYEEEYTRAIESEDVLREWLLNNMNWYELDPVFVRDDRETRLPRLEIEDIDFYKEEQG